MSRPPGFRKIAELNCSNCAHAFSVCDYDSLEDYFCMLGNTVVRPNCDSVSMGESYICVKPYDPSNTRAWTAHRRKWEKWGEGRRVSDHHICDEHVPCPEVDSDITHAGYEKSFLYVSPGRGRWGKSVSALIVAKDYERYFEPGKQPDVKKWPAYSVPLQGERCESSELPVDFGVPVEDLCAMFIKLRDTYKLPIDHTADLDGLIQLVENKKARKPCRSLK